MEAAVVSGILKIVSNKLAPLLIKEYSLIVGVQKHLLELKDQVQEINYWLEAVGHKVSPDTPAFKWLRKLKDISYDVDDIVDEFQLKAEEHDAHGVAGVMSRCMCKKPNSLILQCKAASKIKTIKKGFDAIVKERTEFNAIANSLLDGHPAARDMSQTTANQTTLPTVDVASVLGREQEKHQIISKLVDNKHIIKTISIVGLGGSGKTTLAKLVFNDCSIVEKHFEVRLWVHVSQEFGVDKLIKKLFEAFADNNPGQHALPYMIKTISEKLTGKRLLLVLDDVWTESLIQWENFMVHLKSSAPGSRILVTTRSGRVAETVRSLDQFDLPFLSLDESWQLFQQSLIIPAEGLDSEFVKVGKEIVKKCGGVPLAIKALAGVLHGMQQIQEWKYLRDSNVLDVEGKDHIVSACLRLSYLNLSSHLKQCFTICSLFPKGHDIDKQQLIDLWIAHGMITGADGVDYMENGHRSFNSLVQMSFLQDVEENDRWRVKCKMHDLIHDLSRSILKDEISLAVPNKAATSATMNYRYFSLSEQPQNLPSKKAFKKARAIFVCPPQKDGDVIFGNTLKNARPLRSITMEYVFLVAVPNAIFQVKNLKYLAISGLRCQALPEAISDFWTLQALHVTRGALIDLPGTFGKLTKLRTLNLSMCGQLKCLPDSIGDCRMISSINLSNCWTIEALPNCIGNLEKLIVLNLSHCQSLKKLPDSIFDCHMISNSIDKNEKRLPLSITMLRNLECLDLLGCQELVELPGDIGNMEKLQVLNLEGCEHLAGMPIGIGQVSQLQKLGLFVVGKREKFARLSELANVSRISEKLTIKGISHVMDPDDAHRACLKQKTNLQRLGLDWMSNKMEEVNNEFVNVSRISKNLTIRGISHVMDPDDAQRACLKQMTNLQRLGLNWVSNKMEEANNELQQDVLDGLEPPPGIKELDICGYSGRQYAMWMRSQVGGGVLGSAPFPFLRVMTLYNFPNLKHLHGLVELPCLELLQMKQMPSLDNISGGPFPSLVKLEMHDLACLGEVWMVAEGTMTDGEERGGSCSFTPQLGQVRVGNCLTELVIKYCPKLEVMPHLPLSIQHLILLGSEQLLQSLGQCRSLKELSIEDCDCDSLPQSMGQLTSLQELVITSCNTLQQLPDCLEELCSLRRLEITDLLELTCLPECICRLTTSLRELEINGCRGLISLPQGMEGLISLEMLSIEHCPSLTSLPQGMEGLVSLEKLYVSFCPAIKSLPEGIKGLTALKELHIYGCPDLERRCERETGEDWHLISHIPSVFGLDL